MSVELNLGPQYRALAAIAKGGMGAVYLGEMRDEAGERHTVAIKVMHHHLAESSETLTLFVDEARVGTRILHPNVVRVLATDVVQETPFIVMEYVEGLSWARLTRRAEKAEKPVPVAVAARVVHDALLGLEAAHALENADGENAGVVHRDVSPQNILVGADGVVRITDFGVATFAGRISATAPGELRGKLGYIAPEQMQKGGVDRRADVFAAGIVLWEAIAGRRLFGADTQAETLAKVLSEPIVPPSTFRHEVTLDLDDVCLRALERDKDRRHASAADFASALAAATDLADDTTLLAFLDGVAGPELEKQRAARDEAVRTAGRWNAPDVALAIAADEPTIPRVPRSPARWPRVVMIAAAALVLVVVGTMIGRMSSVPPPTSEQTTAPTPAPVDPPATPPPSATSVGASPERDPIEVTTASAPAPTAHRRPATKPHKTAPPPPAKSGDTRKYVPGEL